MHRILLTLMAIASIVVIPQCFANPFSLPQLIQGDTKHESSKINEVDNLFNGKEHFEEIEDEIIIDEYEPNMSDKDIGSKRHLRAGASVDRLCSTSNISGDNCFITDKSIRFTRDTYYVSGYNLIFN